MKQHTNREKGFTITELSIAMTMLSILLIIILMSIFNIIGIYNKGVTLKRVNQSGRTISTEIQSDLRRSTADVGGVGLRREDTNDSGAIDQSDALTGLCTGKNSYLWNVSRDGTRITSTTFSGEPDNFVSMVKIPDATGAFCENQTQMPEKSKSTVMLDDGLIMGEPISLEKGSNNKLLRFTFTISTENQGSGDDADLQNGSCQGGKDHNFCALNTFTVTSYVKD